MQSLKEKLTDDSYISKTASFKTMCLDKEVLEMLLSAVKDLAAEELPKQVSNRYLTSFKEASQFDVNAYC